MSQGKTNTPQSALTGIDMIAMLILASLIVGLLTRESSQGQNRGQQRVQAAEPVRVVEIPPSKEQLSRAKMFSHSDLDTVEHQMNFWLKREHVLISNIDLSCSSIATVALVTCPSEKTVGRYTQIKMFAGDADTVENQMNAWLKRHGIKDYKQALTTTDTRHISIIAYTATDE